jgi:hypothetical protein
LDHPHAFGQIEGLLKQGCPRHTFEVMRLAIRAQQSATMMGFAN